MPKIRIHKFPPKLSQSPPVSDMKYICGSLVRSLNFNSIRESVFEGKHFEESFRQSQVESDKVPRMYFRYVYLETKDDRLKVDSFVSYGEFSGSLSRSGRISKDIVTCVFIHAQLSPNLWPNIFLGDFQQRYT